MCNTVLSNQTVLVTGAAGFIGANLIMQLLKKISGAHIIGVDCVNDYYDTKLKEYRLFRQAKESETSASKYTFIRGNIADKRVVEEVFVKYKPEYVVNLAAQAGVRYSIENPDVYIESNIIGFYNILEACRHYPVKHLVFASSSSVYGDSTEVPFSTDDKTDTPVSLYAATKKTDELLAYTYSKLYDIPITGLRFFTVYGPAGRPDMAYFSFADRMVRNETVKLFNYGNCRRDFTYIDDVVEGVLRVMKKAPLKQGGNSGLPVPPYAVYNIGNSSPVNLFDFVKILSEELIAAGVLPNDYDINSHTELLPMQSGDVTETYADISTFEKTFQFKPNTELRSGLKQFAQWYRVYYSGRNQE